MSNAIETVKKQPLRQVKNVQHLLWNDQARDQLAAVAAKHMNAERMMRVVANAIRTTPKLQDCEPMSFLGALMQCAALGLEPNTILGHAYMIPFENKRKGVVEVQLVVGYKGLIDLSRRSGHITSIHAGIHYSDDEKTGGLWEYEEGTEARLRHRNGDMNGEKKHAYAIAKFKDGGHAYVVMPWSHVMKIRDASQGYQTAVRYGKKDTPWIAHEDAMAKKTAIRALAKYLPLSVEFSDALSVDEAKADYRAFAMDPSSGIAMAQDDYIEGEAEEQRQPAQIEKQDSVDLPVTDEQPKRSRHEMQKQYREGLKKPPQESRKETVYNPQKDKVADLGGPDVDEQQAEQDQLALNPYETPFGKTFLTDVNDMGFSEAMGFHEDQMSILEKSDPEMHAAILAASREIDPMTP